MEVLPEEVALALGEHELPLRNAIAIELLEERAAPYGLHPPDLIQSISGLACM